MSDALLLQERCRNTIQLGESHFREFKSALEGKEGAKKPRPSKKICQDIGEALVAFANADGGELLVGVEDDGTISGVPHDSAEVVLMLAAPRTHVHPDSILPIMVAEKIMLDASVVLFFSVAKGTTEIYQLPDGRCVRRKDKSTVPEAIRRIQFDRQEIRSREYDREFVDGAAVGDLNVAFIQSMANTYLAGLSVELYLQQAGLAEYASNGLRLRRAALLLFARDIQRWHPRSQVRILKVIGTQLESGEKYNVASDETVQGNIFELLVPSWERLRPFLAFKTEFGSDARFEQRYIYPEEACREALVNAIAHRDYSIQNGIDVFIYDDRMEIKSPGSLLSTLTIDDLAKLQGEHESRNSLISRVLRENKYMRELGEGMKRIFEAMESNEQQEPKLFSNGSWFVITLFHSSVFTVRQQQWLDLFKHAHLSRLQKKIVVLGMDGREISPQDVYKAMNTDDRDTYDREVTALRKAGILAQIRTNVSASQFARLNKIPKNQVPRFNVCTPVITPPVHASTGLPAAILQGQTSTYPAQEARRDSTSEAFVYVRNLSYDTTRSTIENLFHKALGETGRVLWVNMEKSTEAGKSRGYVFVALDSQKSVEKAVQELNGTVVDGRRIRVRRGQPKT